MKKPSSKIRDEIAKLQDALKAAETREAERIGRIALKAGLGEIEINEVELQAAFEDVAKRFRAGKVKSTEEEREEASGTSSWETRTLSSGTNAGGAHEA
jgi:methanogenic corrinoid protein MtbC1